MPNAATAPGSNERRQADTELRPDGHRMLTVAEVADHVRGDVEYVYKLIREGALHATRRTPRKTLICEADVWAFLHDDRS